MIRFGRSSGNGRAAQSGFVGKDSARNAKTHGCCKRKTCNASQNGIWRKCAFHNLRKTCGHIACVCNNNDKAANSIKNCHDRNNFRRYFSNRLDTTQKNNPYEYCNHKPGDPGGNRKCVFYCVGNGIDLCQVSNSKRSDHSKNSKSSCKNCTKPFDCKTVFDGKHWPAGHFAVLVLLAVKNGKDGFAVFGSKAKKGGNPHPEQSARAAERHSGRYADDVAGADCSCQGYHKGLERGNISRVGIVSFSKAVS